MLVYHRVTWLPGKSCCIGDTSSNGVFCPLSSQFSGLQRVWNWQVHGQIDSMLPPKKKIVEGVV